LMEDLDDLEDWSFLSNNCIAREQVREEQHWSGSFPSCMIFTSYTRSRFDIPAL